MNHWSVRNKESTEERGKASVKKKKLYVSHMDSNVYDQGRQKKFKVWHFSMHGRLVNVAERFHVESKYGIDMWSEINFRVHNVCVMLQDMVVYCLNRWEKKRMEMGQL